MKPRERSRSAARPAAAAVSGPSDHEAWLNSLGANAQNVNVANTGVKYLKSLGTTTSYSGANFASATGGTGR